MQGWFKFHRQLFDKPIWTTSTPEQKTILLTLLGMVNFKENEWEFKGEKFIVHPGQCITSLESIAERSGKGITTQNVRTALKRFEKYEFLTSESTNKNRLITVVNWAFYQGEDDEPNKQTNKQLTSNQQATNKQLTTNKECNNVNNEKKDKEEMLLSAFAEFWNAYPRKLDKKKALEKFKAATKEHDPQIIIQGAINYAKECQVKNTEKSFIKHPTTFLNAESFLNDFDTTYSKGGQVRTGRVNSVGKNNDAEIWAKENNIPF